MHNIKISLIIPVYNVDKYLKVMLDSVFTQTFKDFEVIIINDGSNDNSEEIIIEFKNKYNNIIYLKQENRGQSVARNIAIPYIRGKYTIFLDSDDYLQNNMLERMYFKAEENAADIVICAYKKVYDYETNKVDNIIFNASEEKIYNNIDVMNMMLDYRVKGYLWNKMFLTKNIKSNNMKFDEGRIIEDVFPVYKQVSNSEKIVFINEQLYNYRQRVTSSLHLKKTYKSIEDYKVATKSIIEYSKNIYELDKNKLVKFIINSQTIQIIDFLKVENKISKTIYKKSSLSDLSTFDILFRYNIPLKIKIKGILFKFRLLHIGYKIGGLI